VNYLNEIKCYLKIKISQILMRYPTHHKPLKIQHAPKNKPKVLILGIYLEYRENTFNHLISAFNQSTACTVDQIWVSLNPKNSLKDNQAEYKNHANLILVKQIFELKPKFTILNKILEEVDISKYDYLVFTDDDIFVDDNFLDAFIGWQQHLNFCLAQPARTRTSTADNTFVVSRPWLNARETHFVEIGPLFSMHKSIVNELLPFDLESPMGWGYDLVWPIKVSASEKTMGIIDATPVQHSLRPQGAAYSTAKESVLMNEYLSTKQHLNFREACTIVKNYSKISFLKKSFNLF